MSDFPSLHSLMGSTPSNSQNDDAQKKFQKKMEEVKLKEKEMETMKFAAQSGYPYINLESFPISQEALKKISVETAAQSGVICFYYTPEEFRLGALEPSGEHAHQILKKIETDHFSHGALYTISQKSFTHVLEMYKKLPVVKPVTKDISIHPEELEKIKNDISNFSSLQNLIDRKSTTDILVYILAAAFKLGASDLHIEAEEEGIVVRFRLDGILHDAATLPIEAYKKLVSRIKLTSSLKINITDKPQDGRFTIKLSEGDVDVRVSTIPTVYGESIVMRLLRQSRGGLTLDNLGLLGRSFEIMQREIERPNGMIITTGPTGSGKTTTLYAIMQLLNKPGVKIITLEDPVEYKMEGINQSQIDHSKGYTFASGLRSMLRQDPDIAMVGEIRDLETADIAIQAALTGHLMLSTIHTNSASGAIPRFLSMGVKPFLLAPALNCIIGQRLVRRLCDVCKTPQTPSEEKMNIIKTHLDNLPEKEKGIIPDNLVFYTAKGCVGCNEIGYKGRVGIYEIFVMNTDIEQMVLSGNVSEFEIEQVARNHGMITMVQDGLLKALSAVTSLEEVFRVIE